MKAAPPIEEGPVRQASEDPPLHSNDAEGGMDPSKWQDWAKMKEQLKAAGAGDAITDHDEL